MPHDAEYWRNRRARLRLEAHTSPLDHIPNLAAVLARGRQITAMLTLPQLDWASDLFQDDPAAKLYAPTPRIVASHLKCFCGCGKDHRNNVSGTVTRERKHTVRWFYTQKCKDKWVINSRA
jgi:hypothetical protein